MSTQLLKNTKFLAEINSFYKQNEKEIIDIILFGSAVRGKERPADADILVVYNLKANLDLSYNLKKELSSFGKIEIISKAYFQLFEPSFLAREAILGEGYSLVQKKSILEGLGYSSFILFLYNLENMTKTKRMQFYYSLYGRAVKGGVLKELESYKLSERVILTPVKNAEKMKEYLGKWMKFLEIPVFFPSRLINTIIK